MDFCPRTAVKALKLTRPKHMFVLIIDSMFSDLILLLVVNLLNRRRIEQFMSPCYLAIVA